MAETCWAVCPLFRNEGWKTSASVYLSNSDILIMPGPERSHARFYKKKMRWGLDKINNSRNLLPYNRCALCCGHVDVCVCVEHWVNNNNPTPGITTPSVNAVVLGLFFRVNNITQRIDAQRYLVQLVDHVRCAHANMFCTWSTRVSRLTVVRFQEHGREHSAVRGEHTVAYSHGFFLTLYLLGPAWEEFKYIFSCAQFGISRKRKWQWELHVFSCLHYRYGTHHVNLRCRIEG